MTIKLGPDSKEPGRLRSVSEVVNMPVLENGAPLRSVPNPVKTEQGGSHMANHKFLHRIAYSMVVTGKSRHALCVGIHERPFRDWKHMKLYKMPYEESILTL